MRTWLPFLPEADLATNEAAGGDAATLNTLFAQRYVELVDQGDRSPNKTPLPKVGIVQSRSQDASISAETRVRQAPFPQARRRVDSKDDEHPPSIAQRFMKYEGIHGQPGAYWFVVDLPLTTENAARQSAGALKPKQKRTRSDLNLGQARRDEYVPPSRQTLANYSTNGCNNRSTIRPSTHHSYLKCEAPHRSTYRGSPASADRRCNAKPPSALQAPGSNRSKPDCGLRPHRPLHRGNPPSSLQRCCPLGPTHP